MAFGKLGAMGRGMGHLGALGTARPSWVAAGAIIDEDFFNQRAWPRPFAQEMVDTRASTQYVPNADGSLLLVGSATLAISNAYLEIEPAATNILPQSQGIGTAPWVRANTTITAAATAAPDGTSTAQLATTNATSGATMTNTVSGITATTPQTVDFYFKAGSGNGFVAAIVYTPTSVNGVREWFNTSTGVVSGQVVLGLATGVSATSEAIANGWFRGIINVTPNGSDTTLRVELDQSNASGSYGTVNGGGINFWGVEIKPSLSSYVPTTASSATRAANAVTIQRTGIGRIVFTFDDDSQQTVSGIDTGAQYTIPTNLNRPLIKRLTGYTS
jgi:hypothetical protein